MLMSIYKTGDAECPDYVRRFYKVTRTEVDRTADVCGRFCLRESASIGIGPDQAEIPRAPCLGDTCEQAPLVGQRPDTAH